MRTSTNYLHDQLEPSLVEEYFNRIKQVCEEFIENYRKGRE